MIWDSILTLIQNTLGLLDDLSPELNALIAADMPAFKQGIMNRRLRRFKHICRVQKLQFNDIETLAALDFADQPATVQSKIAQLIADELKK
jgi:hypothetical protein